MFTLVICRGQQAGGAPDDAREQQEQEQGSDLLEGISNDREHKANRGRGEKDLDKKVRIGIELIADDDDVEADRPERDPELNEGQD